MSRERCFGSGVSVFGGGEAMGGFLGFIVEESEGLRIDRMARRETEGRVWCVYRH